MTLLDAIEGVHHKILNPSGGCHNCPRHRVDFVPPTLRQSRVIFLGEAPGATEVDTGEGFTGRSGELLRKHLNAIGWEEKDFSLTNTIHCRPPNNIAPKAKEVQCCLSQFVLDEIRGYPIVVMAGNVPLQALFPSRGELVTRATHYRGNVAHHPDFPEQRFYAIYHPAYILRRPDLEDQFARQLERLGRIAQGNEKLPWSVARANEQGFQSLVRECLGSPFLSLDLETTSLKTWTPEAQIRTIAMSADGVRAAVVHREDPQFGQVAQAVRHYLEQEENSVVGSHISYDIDMLEHELGFTAKLSGIHELAVIYYHAHQYTMPSLKELVSDRLDGYRYLVYNPATEADLNLLSMYAGEDVIHPVHLFRKGMTELRPKTRDLVARVVGPASLVVQHITSHGVYMRQNYRATKIKQYQDRRQEAVEAWLDEDPAFIPVEYESGKGLHTYLFRIKGIRPTAFTKTEEPQVDQAAIKQWIREGHSYLQHLLDIRECDKILSTYLLAYDKHVDIHHRIHSSYTLAYTDTGRSSSRDPNLQNIPRVKEIRDLFGVPAGRLMLEADLSQIEFRIMVCLSQDPTGLEGYRRGDDAHAMTARTIAGPNFSKEDRSLAKPVNFSLIYGGSAYNVQRSARDEYGLNWSDQQCEDFTEAFFRTYTRFRPFHEEAKRKLIYNRGWFESIVGHVFYYRDWDNPERQRQDHCFRSALNSEAQGPAAHICFHIMNLATRMLHERNLQVGIVNTVHDSMLAEIYNPKELMDVIATIEEARTVAYEWVKSWFSVPLLLDYKAGESWGSLEDVEF